MTARGLKKFNCLSILFDGGDYFYFLKSSKIAKAMCNRPDGVTGVLCTLFYVHVMVGQSVGWSVNQSVSWVR